MARTCMYNFWEKDGLSFAVIQKWWAAAERHYKCISAPQIYMKEIDRERESSLPFISKNI